MARAGSNKRVIAVGVAILLAGVATAALFSYVRGVEAEALTEAEPVTAFVAKDTIPAGTPAESAIGGGLITKSSIPRRNLAPGAITSLEQISGQVATVNILPGEQILLARFGAAAEIGSGLRQIPKDRQAISVAVELPPGVAGYVNPGDRVSIIAGVKQGADERAQFLLQDVEILGLGQRVIFTNEQQQQGSRVDYPAERVVMTLAVTPQDAEKLAYAVWQGKLYFTLLPKDQKPVGTPGRTGANLFQ